VTDSFRLVVSNFSAVLGGVIIISIVLPWFLIAVFVVFIANVYVAVFYQTSSRDLKVCFANYISNKKVYLMFIYASVLVSSNFSWLNIG
jgi:hypothetical protein